LCIKGKENEPLLTNLRRGLIDPDTPQSAMTRTSADGSKQVLVFSDEFNTDGRTFYDGDDPYFEAVDIWYGATQDLEVSFINFSFSSSL
jgi:beta-glucanase (GH16 family)